jgi:hypothetical protein
MKVLGKIMVLMVIFSSHLMGGEVIDLVDIPTASIYPKGRYGLNLRIHNGGDIIFRFGISLSERVMLGVPLRVQRFIGEEEMEVDLPPVVWAKVAIVKEKDWEWGKVLLGYDPVKYKEGGKRGIFLVLTKSTYIQNFPLGWHIGFGEALDLKERKGIYGFCGLDFGINPNLTLYGELDWIGFGEKENSDFNIGVRYIAPPHLEIDINLRRLDERRTERFIRLGYSANLF